MGQRSTRPKTAKEGKAAKEAVPRLSHECICECPDEEVKERREYLRKAMIDCAHAECDDEETLDLAALLTGNADATDTLHCSLRKHGWQVLRTPPEFQAIVEKYEQDAKRFFEQPHGTKVEHRHGWKYGYTKYGGEEVYRVMSGSDLPDASALPPDLAHSMPPLIDLLERTLIRLHEVLGLSAGEDEFPLLRRPGDARGRFALFDVAYSFNADTAGENLAPHYDPGLLTLSVLSTARGLKLYRNGVWNHPPLGRDRAVIWAGRAAHVVDPRIRRAIYSVDPVEGESRFSAWMELCTEKQVLPHQYGHYRVRSGSETHRAVKLVPKLGEGYIIVPNLSPEAADGAEYRVQLKNGSVMETLHMVQTLMMLPFSNTMVDVHYDHDGTVKDVGPL